MIESITLTNFQIHDTLRLEISEGVTTIVGPSDAGKSAVIRALMWLCFNRPRGDAFITHDMEYAQVRVDVDGHHVVRRRGDRSFYLVDGSSFTAFGTEVPDAVSALLNLGEENFQAQHDAPFWFNLSPAAVSRELNQVVDLGVIDSALTNVSREMRQSRTEVVLSERRLRDSTEQRERLLQFNNADADFAEVEWFFSEYQRITAERRSLGRLAKNVSLHRQSLMNAKARRTKARNCVQMGEKALVVGERVNRLRFLGETADRARNRIEWPDFSIVAVEFERARVLEEKLNRLSDLIQQIEEQQNRTADLSASAAGAHDHLHNQLGGVCPLCKQPIES